MGRKERKITFVCLQLTDGGAERVLSILANAFADRGYDVQFIILFKSVADYELSKKIKVTEFDWENPAPPIEYLRRVKQLRNKVTKKNGIVVAFLFRTIFWVTVATSFSGVKLVFSERNDPHRDPNSSIKRLLRTLCYFRADRIVFQTREQKAYFPTAIRKKGIIIGNPLNGDLPSYDPDTCKKRVITVCRVDEQKNLKMAIDAFERFYKGHDDFVYHIFGRGKLENEINEYIHSKGLDECVKLMGFTDNIMMELQQSMMFVLSSDYEGVSNSMLEAMAVGLPVICTDCPIGGARETINHKVNGFLVRVNDVNAMAHYMSKVADDIVLRNRISRKAKEVYEKHKVDAIVEKWRDEVLLSL